MATPNKELSEKLASRQSRIEAGTTMSDPREGKSLLPPPRPAHERLVPAVVEAASLPSPRMCTEPWAASAAPQLVSPRSTTLTIRVGCSEPAAAPPAAAAATATPAWIAALPIVKVEWYQPGWLSALRAWNTAAVAVVEGSGEAVSATSAAAFGLPAASVVVLEGMGDKQLTVVGLAAESAYRMRVVPGRLLLTSIAKAAFEAGQGRLPVRTGAAAAAGAGAGAADELPKLAAGTEYAVVWSTSPSPESEPLTTLSVEAEKEADKRAALARAAEEAAAAERQAKIAAAKGESGTYSRDTFQARASLFQGIAAASASGAAAAAGTTSPAPARGRPSVGGAASARGTSTAAATTAAAAAPASPEPAAPTAAAAEPTATVAPAEPAAPAAATEIAAAPVAAASDATADSAAAAKAEA